MNTQGLKPPAYTHTHVHTQAHVKTSSVIYPDDTRALNYPHSHLFFFTRSFTQCTHFMHW